MNMNRFLAKYRPTYQIPDNGGGGGNSPASSGGNDTIDSGASPAASPTSTPSATPSPDGGSSSAEEVTDFSFIFGDGEPEPPKAPELPKAVPSKVDPKAKPAAGAEPAKPTTPEAKPAAAPTPSAPATTEATPPTPAPAAGEGNLDPYDPGALARALKANEPQAVQHIADTMFKLTPEEIEGLETNTTETIPKLLARTFVRAQLNMFEQLGRIIPPMMMRQTELLKRHGENEGKFYAKWPDLKQEEHGTLVRQYAAVYRQMNPQASLEQMIEAVGPMVLMAANVVPKVPSAPPNGATPTHPASPMAPAGARPPQPSPFTPAGAVGGGATPQQVADVHPVETMFTADE